MTDTGPGETHPQVPLRERIARAIFVHADHCRCGSGVIDPACITAKEDAVLAEVQTEPDKFSALQDKCKALAEKWDKETLPLDGDQIRECADELRELLK